MFLLLKNYFRPALPHLPCKKGIASKLNAKIYKIFNKMYFRRTFFVIFHPNFDYT